jgi:hypothetical protein
MIRTVDPNILRTNHAFRNPVTGLWERSVLVEGERTNTVVHSEPTPAQLAAHNSVAVTASGGFLGFDRSIHFAPHSDTAWGYANMGNQSWAAGNWITGSFYMEVLDDLGPPVFGTDSSGASADITMVLQGSIVGAAAVFVRHVVGNIYYVWGRLPASASTSGFFGAVRYAAHRQRPFRISGFQVEVLPPTPTSYIKTNGAATTRIGDELWYPYNEAPQPMTIYIRFQERGVRFRHTAIVYTIGSRNYWWDNSLTLQGWVGNRYYCQLMQNGAVVETIHPSFHPEMWDLCEVCISLNTTGSKWDATINGAALPTHNFAGVASFASAFLEPRIYFGGRITEAAAFAFTHFNIQKGIWTMDEMRNIVGV